ncbi:Hypothetical_protein [Hexamita inflata]|uniref:Hypothetical_protein n=1 Tax=Hexamita inflata TaxID=28002 RepID=A0AA86NH64_9EUKA|nr:Hypothetical protein HINF_LOCUS7497 [Hexamita inflata]
MLVQVPNQLSSDFATSEEYLDNLKAARFGHHHEEDADPGQLHNHVDAFAVATVGRFFGASQKEIQKAGQRLHAVFKKDSELQSVAHFLADELQLQVAMNAFIHLELDNSAFKAGCTMLESRLAKYLGQQLGLEEFAGLVSRPLTAAPVLDIVYKLTFAASLDGKLFLEVKSALVKAGCLNNEAVLAKMKEQVAANQTYGARTSSPLSIQIRRLNSQFTTATRTSDPKCPPETSESTGAQKMDSSLLSLILHVGRALHGVFANQRTRDPEHRLWDKERNFNFRQGAKKTTGLDLDHLSVIIVIVALVTILYFMQRKQYVRLVDQELQKQNTNARYKAAQQTGGFEDRM